MKTRLFRIILVLLLGLELAAGASAVLADSQVLAGVPEYFWTDGCSPTSGAMLMGYWAGQSYPQLLPGVSNPMINPGPGQNDPAVNADIHGIAQCMGTDLNTGGTPDVNIAPGLAAWTNSVGLSVNTSTFNHVSWFGGTFTYATFKSEINAGRPMLLNLETYPPGEGLAGHSVLAYGYQDNMFQIRIPGGFGGYQNVTVPGFAVMDTWENGGGLGDSKQSYWRGWDGASHVYSFVDGNGVEWWPFVDCTATGGDMWLNMFDWEIDSAVLYEPTPVPPTLLLLGSGLLGLTGLGWRRRKISKYEVEAERSAWHGCNS
jgi:hypothetical protein